MTTIIDRLRHMEIGHKENGMSYEAEVCWRAANHIEGLEAQLTAETARADAAMKFARHDPNCVYYKGVEYSGDCSCGFDKFKKGQL